MQKTATDRFWNERARSVDEHDKVNIADTVQRDHELEFILRHLSRSMRVAEVGCGNGYVTQQIRRHVAFVDAFDYAENMVARARETYGETNNRFFQDSILAPRTTGTDYDAALCIRVLINLANLEQQRQALDNLAGMLKRGGHLILIEGYREGFEAINALRAVIGLPSAHPAPINFYSSLTELMPSILQKFTIEATFNTGLFDFLTRIVYPALVGAENAHTAGEFHRKIEPIIRHVNSPGLARFARLHGFLLAKI